MMLLGSSEGDMAQEVVYGLELGPDLSRVLLLSPLCPSVCVCQKVMYMLLFT